MDIVFWCVARHDKVLENTNEIRDKLDKTNRHSIILYIVYTLKHHIHMYMCESRKIKRPVTLIFGV